MLQSIFTGLSSLINHRRALDITAHNIANESVEGYSKQRVNLQNNFTRQDGNHQVGVGVHTHSITRMHNDMLFDRVLGATENNASANEEFVHLQRVEEMLVGDGLDGNTISDLTDKFFDKMQDLSANPNDNAVKADIKITGEELIDRGRRLNTVLDDYKSGMKDERELLIEEANGYLKEIDSLTKGIQEVEAFNEFPTYEKSYANDLRDKRDLLEMKLSEIGNFQSHEPRVSEYNFTFEPNGGRLEGIDNGIKNIDKLQGAFNQTFGPLANKVDEFINGPMDNPNEMIDWDYANKPANAINTSFVGFSSSVDNIGNTAGSTEAIMRGLEAQNNKLTKVNIDEEMVNQIRYQRAYEAAAVVIRTGDEMLKTLLDMKR